MKNIENTVISTTCPALINENYEYHLSGDCRKYCSCMIHNKQCIGIYIEDPEDRSNHFFSRAKCAIDTEEIKKCPLYGSSKAQFIQLVKEKSQKELDEKLKIIGEYHVRDIQENQE
jgi:hypothetical protein